MKQFLWEPSKEKCSSSRLAKFFSFIEQKYDVTFSTNYELLWEWSIKQNKEFWPSLIDFLNIQYSGNIKPTISSDHYIYNQKYFTNIQISYAQNILEKLNDIPIIFQNENNFRVEITREEIQKKVRNLVAYLKSIGITKGDRVVAVAANTPDTIISFLATNYLGAIWSSCSPDFGENAILDRFNQINPKLLLYSEIYFYGGKKINIKDKIESVFNKIDTAKHLIKLNYPDTTQEEICLLYTSDAADE